MQLLRLLPLLLVSCPLAVAGVSCVGSEETAVVVEAPAPAPPETAPAQMAPAQALPVEKAPAQVSPGATAQAPAAETPDALPAARAVIDRFVEVTRLMNNLEKTSSMHVKGKFSLAAMGIEGATEVWSAKPDRRLVSVEMGAFGTMLVGYDGKVAWSTHPMMGARLLKGTELLQLQVEANYDSALKPDGRYESMRTIGRETFDGKECFVVEVVARALEGMDTERTRAARTSKEFYEIATGYLLGSTGMQEGELGGGPFTQIQSDYKEFAGQLMASKITVQQSSQEVTMTFDQVEFDTATEATFALPVEVQKMVAAAAAKDAAKPQ